MADGGRKAKKMIKSTKKPIIVKRIEEKMNLPVELREKIDAFWEEQLQKNPYLFNGIVWNVTKLEERPMELELTVKKTDYAHYLYDERHGIEDAYACHNLYSAVLIETADNFLVIGELDETTSYPKCLQVAGGGIDEKDRVTDTFDMVKTVQRELKEEINLELQDKQQIENYGFAYLELPEGDRHSYSVILKAKANLTADQIQEHFEEYKTYLKQTNGETEFERLYFLPKGKAVETLGTLDNPKRVYVKQMLELEDRQVQREENER